MWEALIEASSVLPSMKQTTPSDRFDSGTKGVGDRSDVGKKPWEGQARLWGNLNNQSRGMEGFFDTQGKKVPELFPSHQGNAQSNNPGTFTPPKYKSLYKGSINESANSSETGVQSGKHKMSAASGRGATGISGKYVPGADTKNGGSCNCGKKNVINEGQIVGAFAVLYGMSSLLESAAQLASQG